MAEVWSSTMLDPVQVAVLLVIANSADDDGSHSYPGIPRIAAMSRYSERTVKRTLAELASEGWIGLVARGGGAHVVTEYRVCMERLKQCQSVTLSRGAKTVSAAARKGDSRAKKGVNRGTPPHPLFGGDIREAPRRRAPVVPIASDGDGGVGGAVDQVCSALGISNRRKRKPVRFAIELAMEKGEPAPTVALAVVAAVRRQANLHARRLLKFQFGLQKFLGDGIWRDENRWAWDNQEAKLQAEASVGSGR